MSYKVYTAESLGVINHIAFFIETESDGTGRKAHVVGSVLNGMKYENKPSKAPEHDDSVSFVPDSKILLGTMRAEDMARFEGTCEAVAPPGAQVKLNGKPKDPSKPIRRCGDWVKEVTDKVIAEGILKTEG